MIRVLNNKNNSRMKQLGRNIQRNHIGEAEVKVAREILEMKGDFVDISTDLIQLRNIASHKKPTAKSKR